ncbi:MAG: septum formation initiator family protein [Planctomycetota bacterium]
MSRAGAGILHIIGLRSFWIPLVLVTGLSAAVCIPLSNRRAGLKELRKREARLRARLGRLRDRNGDLRARRNKLLSSLEQIERVARQEYGFRGRNEYVETITTRPPDPSLQEVDPVEPDEHRWWSRILKWGTYPWRIPATIGGISFFVIPLLNALGASKPAPDSEDD